MLQGILAKVVVWWWSAHKKAHVAEISSGKWYFTIKNIWYENESLYSNYTIIMSQFSNRHTLTAIAAVDLEGKDAEPHQCWATACPAGDNDVDKTPHRWVCMHSILYLISCDPLDRHGSCHCVKQLTKSVICRKHCENISLLLARCYLGPF